MNDAIESVMSFINENTTILISICVFLIFVLVVYLVRSSTKSKKIDQRLEAETLKTQNLVTDHIENAKKEQKINEANKKFEDAIIEDDSNKITVEAEDLSTQKEEPKEEDKNVDVLYKNDKKLSEILFGDIEKQPEGKLDDSLVVQDEPKEKLESADELEEIMKKLNSYNDNINN